MLSNVFHYGQACFEGLKVYNTVDNRVISFRDDENLSRINLSANRLAMPEVPESIWTEAIDRVVVDNLD